MSGRSGASGSVRSAAGSVRLGTTHEVVLDALYERKRDKKTVRVLTVIIYVFSVSLAAIMLSLYYVFFWEPKDAQYAQRKVAHNVDQQTSTTPMPTCFMPHTGGGDSTVSEAMTSPSSNLSLPSEPPDPPEPSSPWGANSTDSAVDTAVDLNYTTPLPLPYALNATSTDQR
ncbi:hypothetical protein O0L34_g938 [Tuta absoluta]|nr:hypothetical protein O0L34_g938 [Tuta absoluta]